MTKRWLVVFALWLVRKLDLDLRPWPVDVKALDVQYQALRFTHAQYLTQHERLSDAVLTLKNRVKDLTVERDAHKAALARVEKRGAFELDDGIWGMVARARELVFAQDVDTAPGTSGEYKRRQVYSRLLKEFPAAIKRDVSIAIELAVR